jgi:gliding motility-associated-like protein
MKHLLKILFITFLTCFSSLSVNAQTPIPVCAQTGGFTGAVRGYYFTAPANFTICGLYVEDDMSTAFQAAAIVRFTAGPPPAYAATTNSFVTLFQNLNYVPNNMIPVPNIAINAGDIIGIYGARTANSVNSYGPANCVITIAGIPTITFRSGMQFDLAAGPGMHDIWNENTGSIGRVTMYTGCCPSPAPIAAVAGPTIVCEGDTVTYTVPAQTGATAYNWTVPAGATIIGGQNTTSLNVTWNTVPGGNVCVDWTDACGTSTPTCLAVTVNPNILPTFTQITAICSGDPLAPLPTTSTNGITGTWSPAVNNTATTTYTFTPTAGLCATTTTMTITVNPNILPTFTQVAAICSGDPLAPLPTTSTNAITGTWSPAVNNTATTTYTFTPTVGLCATTTTMTITVNPNILPTFTQVAAICSGDPLAPLPTTSTNAITGTWAPVINNTATTTYTFTPTVGLCATTTTMIITVNPNILPTFTQITAICSGDPLAPLPTTSTNGIVGTWTPATNNTTTTLYTFTPTAGLCATTTTMTITVNPQIVPTFTQIAAICSGDPLAPLPTTSTNAITGTWSPTVNNTATTTYTFTPTVGLCATTTTMSIIVNPQIVPAFTQIAAICSGDPLAPLPTTSTNAITGTWSPTVNNTATTTYTFTPTVGLCATTTTMTITVGPPVTPTFTQIAAICSGDILAPLPTTSTNAITGTWAPAVNNTATTVYTFTPTAGVCAFTNTLTITVNPQIVPTFTQVVAICSGDPLAPLPPTSTNAITGTWSPAVNNTATTVYTFIPTVGVCATTATMTITVNPPTLTTFTQVATICSGDLLAALQTTSTNAITGTWSPAISNAATTTYTFTPTAGLCATTTTMTITVNPIVSGSTNASICQGDSILIGGVFVSTAGSYTETLTSSVGCDSILTTNLSINPITSSTLSFTICLGDSVFIESVYYYSDTIVPYTYTSSTGCDSIVNYEVTTSPLPVFSIVGGSAFINLGQSVDLAVMPGVAGTTYFWDPPTGLSCLFCQNPTATPTESMWYFVTVTNANGCSLIDSTFIDVDPSSSIYVPNIFSPNKDGNNDIYLVQGKGIQVFDLSIYNRWGQKVFESDDIEKGWDGTKEGTILNQGVFVYDLKVLFYTGKTFEQTGNITIVR